MPKGLSSRIVWSRRCHKDLRQVAIEGFIGYPRRMNTVIGLFGSLWNALGCVGELLGYLLRFVSIFFRTRASLAARLLAAESQLGMCKRRIEQKQHPKPRFSRSFRILWVVLSKLWAPWQAAAQLMQPATVMPSSAPGPPMGFFGGTRQAPEICSGNVRAESRWTSSPRPDYSGGRQGSLSRVPVYSDFVRKPNSLVRFDRSCPRWPEALESTQAAGGPSPRMPRMCRQPLRALAAARAGPPAPVAALHSPRA